MTDASYDAIADWYDQLVQEDPLYREIILPNMMELVGDVRDAVVCDLACLQSLRRILKPGGWLVFCITHPCFQTPDARWGDRGDGIVVREVRGYFDERFWMSENSHGVRGRVGEHHRMLGTYINALSTAGLLVERMIEPQATGRRAQQVPGNREVPSVMLVRTRAGQTG